MLSQSGRVQRLLTVASVDATEDQIAHAAKDGSNLVVARWEELRPDAPAAFVFDLIAVPAGAEAAELDRLQESIP